jgi:hypothetical protein
MKNLTLYWNRRPGVFVNKNTGQQVQLIGSFGPMFTGSVREWYETLVETIIDLRNQLHRGAGKNSREINVYVDPDVRCILESTILYKPSQGEGFKPNMKKSPRGLIGTLCGMNVIESKKVERFEVEMEFKTGINIERGKVKILED